MQIDFKDLVRLANRSTAQLTALNSRSAALEGPFFTTATGFHIYGLLDLELSIAAPEDESAAQQYLEILQAYASIAEKCGEADDIEILEVQGDRIHMFFETQDPVGSRLKVIRFAAAMTNLVYSKIGRMIGDTRMSFRMAADFGPAILLLSNGEDVSESIVSLGNAANRPAKKLTRGVEAGYLALSKGPLGGGDSSPENWEIINVRTPLEKEQERQKEILFNRIDEGLDTLIANSKLATFSARDFAPSSDNPVHEPIRRQGFMFRADLDGFSVRVKRAMNGSDEEKLRLVADFNEIMKYPVQFKDRLPGDVSVLLFPWAGDCANLLLICDDYNLARTFLPTKAASEWHAQEGSEGFNKRAWRDLFGASKWVIGMAGGDNSGAEHGYVLTAKIVASGRTFHVGGGWGWRRSLDAQQSEGTLPEDTVIQHEDYSGLDQMYREPYRLHGSLFYKAPYSALRKVHTRRTQILGVSEPLVIPAINRPLPRPRPYAS